MISHFANTTTPDWLKSLRQHVRVNSSTLHSGYWLVAALALALALGYGVGSVGSLSSAPETSSFRQSQARAVDDATTKLRQQLDDARDRLQLSLDNAERVDDLATMQWIKTGKFEDRHHMNVAKDATEGIRAAIKHLE